MLSIQTDYSTLTAVLGRRAHSHREALSSAAFVADQVLRSCSSYALRRRFVGRPSICAWRVVVSMHISKESERFISVRAAAAQNPPQTFRVRERSKSGYASRLLSARCAWAERPSAIRERGPMVPMPSASSLPAMVARWSRVSRREARPTAAAVAAWLVATKEDKQTG